MLRIPIPSCSMDSMHSCTGQEKRTAQKEPWFFQIWNIYGDPGWGSRSGDAYAGPTAKKVKHRRAGVWRMSGCRKRQRLANDLEALGASLLGAVASVVSLKACILPLLIYP